jgi:SAM-dependent methyltransferase
VADYDRKWQEVYGDIQDVGPVHRHMRRIVSRVLAGVPYETAAEVGCGAGHNFDLIGTDVTGFDISTVALDAAREHHPGADLHVLDIETEQPDGSYDLVFCSLVLEHLPGDEAALAHLRAMTRGHLLLTTMAGDYARYRTWEDQVGHVRNYARGELEAKLARAGFETVQAIYWGFPFYTPLARTLQNRMTSAPVYDRRTRVLARLMYALYFLNSSRRGDLLVVLAR